MRSVESDTRESSPSLLMFPFRRATSWKMLLHHQHHSSPPICHHYHYHYLFLFLAFDLSQFSDQILSEIDERRAYLQEMMEFGGLNKTQQGTIKAEISAKLIELKRHEQSE